MDAIRASGGPLKAKLGDEERIFSRLSRRQFSELMAVMPVVDEDSRAYLSVFNVHQWAGTPDGAVQVLALSLGIEAEEVETMGTMVEQATIATLIVGESIMTRDEQPAAEGKKRSDPACPTTPKKRS